jgi:hypothetical protein
MIIVGDVDRLAVQRRNRYMSRVSLYRGQGSVHSKSVSTWRLTVAIVFLCIAVVCQIIAVAIKIWGRYHGQ